MGEETELVNISPSQWGLKCQGVMIPGMPDWGKKFICGYTGCTCKHQSQPMGFEMLGSDDSWYARLGEEVHLWIYWLHLLGFCKAL